MFNDVEILLDSKTNIDEYIKILKDNGESTAILELVMDDVKSYRKIEEESLAECEKEYPIYKKQIKELLGYFKHYLMNEHERKIFSDVKGIDIEWLLRKIMKLSDVIESEACPIGLKDWRNPIILEYQVIKHVISKVDLKDPNIKSFFLDELKKSEFYNTPLGDAFEKVMTDGFVSSEDLARGLGITQESLDKETDYLIESGKFTEGKEVHTFNTIDNHYKKGGK